MIRAICGSKGAVKSGFGSSAVWPYPAADTVRYRNVGWVWFVPLLWCYIVEIQLRLINAQKV